MFPDIRVARELPPGLVEATDPPFGMRVYAHHQACSEVDHRAPAEPRRTVDDVGCSSANVASDGRRRIAAAAIAGA